MTLHSWYERLSKRERMLLLAIGGIVFVVLNLMVWSWLLGALASRPERTWPSASLRARSNRSS